MTDMERRIIAAVDEQKDDLIAFFRELLQCRSFTGKEQEVAAKLIGGLRARGMAEVELVERTPGPPAPSTAIWMCCRPRTTPPGTIPPSPPTWRTAGSMAGGRWI